VHRSGSNCGGRQDPAARDVCARVYPYAGRENLRLDACMLYGGCPGRKLAWGRPQGCADVQYAREACADWHMGMHMYYVGVCLVWMHVPPSVMATTAAKDMYARPDASLPRRAPGSCRRGG
jgi:hypothetical protein